MIERDRSQEHLETEQFSLFVGRNFLVTFQEKAGDCFNSVRNRLKGSDSRLRNRGADFLAYSLLDNVVDAYFRPLERFGDQLERMEIEFESAATPEWIGRLHQMRSDLLLMRRAVWPLREAINNLLRELHFAQVSQRTNDVMKVLTIISTIFIPLSFVTGLYGMNFDTSKSPYNMPELESQYGYVGVLGVMLVIAAVLLYFFYRRGWLSRD